MTDLPSNAASRGDGKDHRRLPAEARAHRLSVAQLRGEAPIGDGDLFGA